MPEKLIAIDLRPIDRASTRGGQFRYAVDLVRGLAGLNPASTRFLVIGSLPEPLRELRDTFGERAWRYRVIAPLSGRGSYYRELVRTAWLLAREKVALVHILFGPFPILAPCAAILTVHDLMFELFPEYAGAVASRLYRLDRWSARRRARRIIAISETTASDLNRLWGLDPAKIDVVQHGSTFVSARLASTVEHDGCARFGELCAGATLLSPYNLEPRKNLSTLLKAIAIVRRQYPALRLLLFGRAAITPEREDQFERQLAELELREAVHMLGFVSDQDLAWLYRHTTLFVFPSLYEGFGLPVLEAMAAGACVVARNASAMAEIVGDAGALVETADPATLAETITALLGAPERRARLAAGARERSRSFTVERMARLTYASYCAALGDTGNATLEAGR
jgi:glycosyltransferase involved in cell wall biosynthesis